MSYLYPTPTLRFKCVLKGRNLTINNSNTLNTIDFPLLIELNGSADVDKLSL